MCVLSTIQEFGNDLHDRLLVERPRFNLQEKIIDVNFLHGRILKVIADILENIVRLLFEAHIPL